MTCKPTSANHHLQKDVDKDIFIRAIICQQVHLRKAGSQTRNVATRQSMVKTAWEILANLLFPFPKYYTLRDPEFSLTPVLTSKEPSYFIGSKLYRDHNKSKDKKRRWGQLKTWQLQKPLFPCLPSLDLMEKEINKKQKQNRTLMWHFHTPISS